MDEQQEPKTPAPFEAVSKTLEFVGPQVLLIRAAVLAMEQEIRGKEQLLSIPATRVSYLLSWLADTLSVWVLAGETLSRDAATPPPVPPEKGEMDLEELRRKLREENTN
jgi:hypothetical protein